MGYDYLPSDKMQIKLIQSLSDQDFALYDKYIKVYQNIEDYSATILKYAPFIAVRLYELFFPAVEGSRRDPDYGLFGPLFAPLNKLAKEGTIHSVDRQPQKTSLENPNRSHPRRREMGSRYSL